MACEFYTRSCFLIFMLNVSPLSLVLPFFTISIYLSYQSIYLFISIYVSISLFFDSLFYLNAIFISIDLCFILLQSLWISRTMTWPRSGSSWATMCRPSNPSRPPSSAFLGTGCFNEGVFSSIIFNILPCCRRDGPRKQGRKDRRSEGKCSVIAWESSVRSYGPVRYHSYSAPIAPQITCFAFI